MSGGYAIESRYAPNGELAEKSETDGARSTLLNYGYDDAGRLTSVDYSSPFYSDRSEYTYYEDGQRVSYQLKQGGVTRMSVSYGYNAQGLLESVTNGSAKKASYAYNPNGGILTETIYTDNINVSTIYTYNRLGLPTSETHKKGNDTTLKFDYSYYADGNQYTKIGGDPKKPRTTTYIFDGAGRLASEVEKEGSTTQYSAQYTYDRSGNRSAATVIAKKNAKVKTTAYTYDSNNRLTGESSVENNKTTTVAYTYDSNGNTLTKATTEHNGKTSTESYAYNELNRQTQAVTSGGVHSYAYRADGLRESKTLGSSTTTHAWDLTDIAAEFSGSKSTLYLRGNGLIFADNSNGGDWHYQKNAHSDVVQLMNSTGNATHTYTYEAFGSEREESVSGTDPNPFRYCGEYYDTETGSIYLRARYYAPGTGRFTQADTHWNPGNMVFGDSPAKLGNGSYAPNMLAIAQSGNLYAYCAGNPVMYKDSSGNEIIFAVLGTIALGSIALGGIIDVVSSPGFQRSWNEFVTGAGNALNDLRDSIWNGIDAIGKAFASEGDSSASVPFIALPDTSVSSPSRSSSVASSSSTKTRTLPDVKIKFPEKSLGVYQFAYVNQETGALIRVYGNMTYSQAVMALNGSAIVNSLKTDHRGYWGIYTHDQAYAKALAITFGGKHAPEVHGNGYYGHYHGNLGTKEHAFHVWYGGSYSY